MSEMAAVAVDDERVVSEYNDDNGLCDLRARFRSW